MGEQEIMGQIPTRTTLTSEVEKIIQHAIVGGMFDAGQRVTESRIAQQFNVSRAPVREALAQLKHKNLLVYFPFRGYFIPELDIEDVEELFLLRIALEKMAVGLVIDRASSDDLTELAVMISEMEKTSAENGLGIAIASELDLAFHEKICNIAQNKPLIEVWHNMASQITVALLNINRSFLSSWSLAQGHREILEAIRLGDRGHGKKVIERHLLQGLENLRSTL